MPTPESTLAELEPIISRMDRYIGGKESSFNIYPGRDPYDAFEEDCGEASKHVASLYADSRALSALREKLGPLLNQVADGERIRVSVRPAMGTQHVAWYEYPLSPADAAECLKRLEGG